MPPKTAKSKAKDNADNSDQNNLYGMIKLTSTAQVSTHAHVITLLEHTSKQNSSRDKNIGASMHLSINAISLTTQQWIQGFYIRVHSVVDIVFNNC